MHQHILNYIRNREAFYCTLFERVIDPVLKNRLEQAVLPLQADQKTLAVISSLSAEIAATNLFRALCVTDFLKKEGTGVAYGKTTISFVEALERSRRMEEMGRLLFSHLHSENTKLQAALKTALSGFELRLQNVIELTDYMKYKHRFVTD